jgi:hypothetical protein
MMQRAMLGRKHGRGFVGLIVAVVTGDAPPTAGNAERGSAANWASPGQTALSGDTPIVAVVTGDAAPTAGVLIVAQKGLPHPAAYGAESIAQIDEGVFAVAWRVPGASYAAGILGATASVTLEGGGVIDVAGGAVLPLANWSPEALAELREGAAGGW